MICLGAVANEMSDNRRVFIVALSHNFVELFSSAGSRLRRGAASSLHASDRCTRRARVSLRPTAAIHERQEIADDAIELVGRLEVDGMAAVRHDGESGGGDILFHQHTRQQTGPILVTG